MTRNAEHWSAIQLDHVTKTFGGTLAVDDLSLHVPAGSIYGFIGPNGSGKTTTLRMVLNILRPDAGEVRLFGEPLRGSRDARVGYLPEERGLYPRMRVREFLGFIGELRRGRAHRPEVDAWLERFELTAWAERKIETLSKGMAQKVQFIAAVLGEPTLLVLDEPFSGLDPVNTDVLRRAVLDLRARGATVVFSTHDMAMAERLCDFIFMIFRGRKVLDGTLTAIQDRYAMDTVRVCVESGHTLPLPLPGVAHVEDSGNLQELRLEPGADPQTVLGELMRRTRLRSFAITQPSLHDIFVRIARPEAQEVAHA
jgi:ABC-2 type transport system ATP-binding protein